MRTPVLHDGVVQSVIYGAEGRQEAGGAGLLPEALGTELPGYDETTTRTGGAQTVRGASGIEIGGNHKGAWALIAGAGTPTGLPAIAPFQGRRSR